MKVLNPHGTVPVAIRGLQRKKLAIKPNTQAVMEPPKKHHHHHHHHRQKHHRHRSLSPAVHATAQGDRASKGTLAHDPQYHRGNQDIYPHSSTKASGERTIPISTSAYSADPRAAAYYSAPGYGNYSSRPRAGTYADSQYLAPHPTAPSSTSSSHYDQSASSSGSSSRHKPPLIHTSMGPASSSQGYDQGYYLSPSSSTAPRRERKKRYSMETGYPSQYIEADAYQDPYARDGYDRRDYQGPSASTARKGYHLTGSSGRPQDFDDDSYSYTDAVGMYRDTEPPRWRQRSGSVDRGPERPRSLYDSYGPRELGPPPTSRGFDRINEYYHAPQGLRGPRDLVASPARKTSVRSANPVGDPYADLGRAPPRHQPALHQDRDDRRYDSKAPDSSRNVLPRHGKEAEGDGGDYRDYGPREGNRERHTRHHDAYSDEPPYKPAERRELLANPHATYKDDRQEKPARRQPEIVREPDSIHPENSERHGNAYDNHHRDRYDEHDRDRRRDISNHRGGNGHMHEAAPAAIGAAGVAAAGLAAKAGAAAGSRSEDNNNRPRGFDPRDHHREREREGERDRVPEKDRHRDYYEEPDRRRKAERDGRGSPDGAEHRERHYVETTPEREVEDRRREPRIVDDPDEDYRRRVKREIEQNRNEPEPRHSTVKANGRSDLSSSAPTDTPGTVSGAKVSGEDAAAISITAPSDSSSASDPDSTASSRHRHHRHHQSTDDNPVSSSSSSTRENRVRILPPSKHSRSRRNSSPPDPANATAVKGILRKPTEKFPEDPNPVLEGVAPLKDASKKKGIPPDARWTKIARRMVNPEALEEAKERFVERLDCVIVLRVLTKEEIQKFATRTAEIREEREHEERREQCHNDRRRHRSSKKKHRSSKSGDGDTADDDDSHHHHSSSSSSSSDGDNDGSSSGSSSHTDDNHHHRHRDGRRGHHGDHESDGSGYSDEHEGNKGSERRKR